MEHVLAVGYLLSLCIKHKLAFFENPNGGIESAPLANTNRSVKVMPSFESAKIIKMRENAFNFYFK